MAEIVGQLSAMMKIKSDEELEEKEDDSCAREMKVTKLSQLLSELLETERKYVQDLEQVLHRLFKWVFQLCVAGLWGLPDPE